MDHLIPKELVCSFCGSSAVVLNTGSKWNKKTQEFELVRVAYRGSCDGCDRKDVKIITRHIAPSRKLANEATSLLYVLLDLFNAADGFHRAETFRKTNAYLEDLRDNKKIPELQHLKWRL